MSSFHQIDYEVDLIEESRQKEIKIPSRVTSKAFEREKIKKQNILNQNITIQILDPITKTERNGCSFQIRRKNLTKNHLQTLINHSPAAHDKDGYSFSYIRDFETGEAILPRDMRSHCKVKPTKYYTVKRVLSVVDDQLKCANYEGDSKFMLCYIPCKTQNQKHRVMEKDVKKWIISCIVNDDGTIKKCGEQIEILQRKIKELTREMKLIPIKPIYNIKGKELKGDKTLKEREKQFGECSNEKDLSQAQLDKAIAKRRSIWKEKSEMIRFSLKKMDNDNSGFNENWIFEFLGLNKEYYENIVLHKSDWNTIHMFVDPPNMNLELKRESISHDQDSEYFVDMSGISLYRIKDGFGVYYSCEKAEKNLDENNNKVSIAPKFKLDYYQGTFVNNERSGYGLVFNDEGIYIGQMQGDLPCGKGLFYSCTGDRIEGEFGKKLTTKEQPELVFGKNPYERGLPNGQGKVVFADGSFYEGEMKNGLIDGKGVYINAIGEKTGGCFEKGLLQGNGNISTAMGEKFKGNFADGELHGYGSFISSNNRFEGIFDRGLKYGKGEETLHINIMPRIENVKAIDVKSRRRITSKYRGFFGSDRRIWHGHMFISDTLKEKEFHDTLEQMYEFNQHSPWLEARIKVSTDSKKSNFERNNCVLKSKMSLYRSFKQLVDGVIKKNMKRNEKKHKINEFYRLFRQEINNKKRKIFEELLHKSIKIVFDPGITQDHQSNQDKDMAHTKFFEFRSVNVAPTSLQEAEISPGLRVEVRSLNKERSEIKEQIQLLHKKIENMKLIIPNASRTMIGVQDILEKIEQKWKLINLERLKHNVEAKEKGEKIY